jgi:nicotinamidase-related amidase
MIRADRLDADRAMVLVVDIQEKLFPLIRHKEQMLEAAKKLLDGARVFGLPVVATEQYPKGIGPTVPLIKRSLEANGAGTYEKVTFSSCGVESFRAALREIDRPQVLMTGIECHVCVQQSALDLLTMDYQVFVCADAVGSRGRVDYERALLRMQHAGAVITTVEAALFELCERSGTDRFRALLEVIKSSPPPAD